MKGITMKKLKEITKPTNESLEQLTNNKGDEYDTVETKER